MFNVGYLTQPRPRHPLAQGRVGASPSRSSRRKGAGGPGKYTAPVSSIRRRHGCGFHSTRNKAASTYWKEWIRSRSTWPARSRHPPGHRLRPTRRRQPPQADPVTRLAYGEDVCLIHFARAGGLDQRDAHRPIDSRFCLRFANLRERDETAGSSPVKPRHYTRKSASCRTGDPGCGCCLIGPLAHDQAQGHQQYPPCAMTP